MCTWDRPERFSRTLIDLANQRDVRPSVLLVWNNNRSIAPELRQSVRSVRPDFPVRIINSHSNIGGFGRFYAARALAFKGERSVVTIDDDVELGDRALSTFVDEHKPASTHSFWSWSFTNEYTYARNRTEPEATIKAGSGTNVEADYCGTGGMITDTQVFLDANLFTCPEKFWFIEDLWLSFYAATQHGYKLRGSAASVEQKDDGKNIYYRISDQKAPMLRNLMSRYGWELVGQGGKHEQRSLDNLPVMTDRAKALLWEVDRRASRLWTVGPEIDMTSAPEPRRSEFSLTVSA